MKVDLTKYTIPDLAKLAEYLVRLWNLEHYYTDAGEARKALD